MLPLCVRARVCVRVRVLAPVALYRAHVCYCAVQLSAARGLYERAASLNASVEASFVIGASANGPGPPTFGAALST